MPSCEIFVMLFGCVFSLQMIARGKNASDLFPAVVKNVACKNIEVGNEPSLMLLHVLQALHSSFSFLLSYHIFQTSVECSFISYKQNCIFLLHSLTGLISVKIIKLIHIGWMKLLKFKRLHLFLLSLLLFVFPGEEAGLCLLGALR